MKELNVIGKHKFYNAFTVVTMKKLMHFEKIQWTRQLFLPNVCPNDRFLEKIPSRLVDIECCIYCVYRITKVSLGPSFCNKIIQTYLYPKQKDA